jgi:hypothetical protein
MNNLMALTCAGWLTLPGPLPPTGGPLFFGMNPQEAANALQAPLEYVSGKPDGEIFFVVRSAGIPAFYRVDQRLYLQFRKGCLSGWKKDWRRPRRWLF